jgi:hypothetical protein
MKRKITALTLTLILLAWTASYAGFGLGADIYSRYVWRGRDFGNAVSVQPALSYTVGGFEIGAWASYPIDNGSVGANENDLYITYSIGNLGLTISDYYFPETGDVFNYRSEDAIHFLESSVSYSLGSVGLLAGYLFSGDADNSVYAEISWDFYEKEDVNASLVVGAGNGMYVVEDDFNAVNVGLTVSSGSMSASYIINPDAETNFLVFGYSF